MKNWQILTEPSISKFPNPIEFRGFPSQLLYQTTVVLGWFPGVGQLSICQVCNYLKQRIRVLNFLILKACDN
ncbi:hypothetical protein AMR42_06055 [Limnothrix sp. PR1529]|nr:hypothetical protein BCR12_07545 [Limnothrix sp. P13C2]PIB14478.1 hypothetical protein AMR42_06055 [Limnothrix sp. PR1529]